MRVRRLARALEIELLRRGSSGLRPGAAHFVFLDQVTFVNAADARDFEADAVALERGVFNRQDGMLVHTVEFASVCAFSGRSECDDQMELSGESAFPRAFDSFFAALLRVDAREENHGKQNGGYAGRCE